MAQDYLRAAQQEEGSLKEGQRYWASFALTRVQSAICERQMRELLEDDNAEHAPIESGVLLLVSRNSSFLRAFMETWLLHARLSACPVSFQVPGLLGVLGKVMRDCIPTSSRVHW